MIVGHIGAGSSESQVDTGDIEHSLRNKGASGNRLSRTFGARTSGTTGTLSMWIKRGQLGAVQYLMGGSNYEAIRFNADDKLFISNVAGTPYWTTTQVFRDPSAWLHIHIAWDTTQALAANRGRVWINGTEITAWDSKPDITQNSAFVIWNTNGNVGTLLGSAYFDQNFNGYGARICWVDGAFLPPTDFGYFNTEINEWVTKSQSEVKAVVDAGGANSFMLDFDDGTSLTTLGYDKSTKGNHWTLNGHSLTAGVNYDWMEDVPGNSFAVLNPLNYYSGDITLSYGNLRYSGGNNGGACPLSIPFDIATAQLEIEVTIESGPYGAVGVVPASENLVGAVGATANQRWYYGLNGQKHIGASNTAYGATFTTGDKIKIRVDAGAVEFFKNGVSQGVAWSGLTGEWCFLLRHAATVTMSIDAGQQTFAPTTGFKALCQRELETPAILDPTDHHTVLTLTKSGDTNFTLPWSATLNDTLFWIKRRDAAGDWYQIDGLRGYDKILKSNSTAAETTDANVLGVSGTTCTLKSTLPNGVYVVYAWKAGLVAERATNTDGSITSTVSANVEAGFSIVTYTGTGANATVGHGLGVAPKMYSTRVRGGANYNWPVYHAGLTSAAYWIPLQDTSAQIVDSTAWNSTAPTSSVFSVGTGVIGNLSGGTVIAYCHAEIPGYSKFGSYTGNGSADGPFVWADGSPMDVLIKSSTLATSWYQFDSLRSNNENKLVVFPDTNAVEANNVYGADLLSSGVKVRAPTGYGLNNTSATYIYAAYSKSAFKFSNSR